VINCLLPGFKQTVPLSDHKQCPSPMYESTTIAKQIDHQYFWSHWESRSTNPNGNPFNISSVVQGTFNQYNTNLFTAPSIGNQCTCTALIALCKFCTCPPVFNVNPFLTVNELDDILMKGNELYLEMGANGYLSFDNLPNVVTNVTVHKMSIQQLKPSYVHCDRLNSSQTATRSLRYGLEYSFHQSHYVLIMVGVSASAIYRDEQDKYVLYDSHGRDSQGRIGVGTPSCLIYYGNMIGIERYIRYMSSNLCSKKNPLIELLPISIDRNSPMCPSFRRVVNGRFCWQQN
jgi:hypothetical protein